MLRLGRNACGNLARDLREAGGRRPLVLVTGSLMDDDRVRTKLKEALSGCQARYFSNLRPHVPLDTALEVVQAARSHGADSIVSVGGGSVIDAGKVAVLASSAGAAGFEDLLPWRVSETASTPAPPLRRQQLPHFAVPTTLSGAELTDTFTVTVRAEKHMFSSPRLRASWVYLDSSVTMLTPDWLWAATGARAIDHCVEFYLSRRRMPAVKRSVELALPQLTEHLPRSVGRDRSAESRTECQLACVAVAKGATESFGGLSHALGHQVGAALRVPHGHTSSVLLPRVLEFELEDATPQLARLAGLVFGAPVEPAGEAARRFIAELRRVFLRLELPDAFVAGEIDDGEILRMAGAAVAEPGAAENIRQAAATDAAAIIRSAFARPSSPV